MQSPPNGRSKMITFPHMLHSAQQKQAMGSKGHAANVFVKTPNVACKAPRCWLYCILPPVVGGTHSLLRTRQHVSLKFNWYFEWHCGCLCSSGTRRAASGGEMLNARAGLKKAVLELRVVHMKTIVTTLVRDSKCFFRS